MSRSYIQKSALGHGSRLLRFKEFLEAIELLIEANGVKESILNIYLTPGDRSPDPAELIDSVPFLLMVTRPWPNYDINFRSVLDLREESFKKSTG